VHLAELLKVVQLPSTKANIAAALSLLTRSETQTWSLLASGALETLVDMLRAAQAQSSQGTPEVHPSQILPFWEYRYTLVRLYLCYYSLS